ncbi:MAG: hypothetical protein COV09_01645 [Candidatus Vogelbacteria bacterium CG10_big_fil_rev_8_21_14_0_10_50_13]|uniref:Uncharacterized protein n=1 Tax=Candidatus Vogelbacteria bacterium CG10_big_fil_rev_8_21_14_0_10_50_13 TaxID=1975044 RepID=A0A2H0RFT3_9BACT|nr:MAG: hypothetical protein COV09_01645 [Candidatus Vogelbacteria bacterium CG10_big_fil_rev_8_21_14_0_10_50_13]
MIFLKYPGSIGELGKDKKRRFEMGMLIASELKVGDEAVVRFVKKDSNWDLWEKAEIVGAIEALAHKFGVKFVIFVPSDQSDTIVARYLPGLDDRLIAKAVGHRGFIGQIIPAGTYNGRHLQ